MGPIVRLVDPHGLGERLKPFVFLDFFDAEIKPGFGFGMHPHSGIATLTWQPGSDVAYQDTTGQDGVLRAGGLEWMSAGGGAWHRGQLLGRGRATGFQLWVAMPPVIEDNEAFGQYVPPEQVPRMAVPGGELLVLLGEMSALGFRSASPIESHQRMNYFVVSLDGDATWQFSPPEDHDVAWAFVFYGDAKVQGQAVSRELIVLDAEGDIHIAADGGAVRVLVGTAAKHNYPLVLGPSSVHTQRASLQAGHQRIQAIGSRLRNSQRTR
jgi:redox-sensitive bicupin YhaK (pirin superfamily)